MITEIIVSLFFVFLLYAMIRLHAIKEQRKSEMDDSVDHDEWLPEDRREKVRVIVRKNK